MHLRGTIGAVAESDTDVMHIVFAGVQVLVMVLFIAIGSGTFVSTRSGGVPKGVEHKTHADSKCEIILFQSEKALNTGNLTGDMTVEHTGMDLNNVAYEGSLRPAT